jgi:hypothetical protein
MNENRIYSNDMFVMTNILHIHLKKKIMISIGILAEII